MGEIFKLRRRIFGLATLLLAGAAMTAWFRSMNVTDLILIYNPAAGLLRWNWVQNSGAARALETGETDRSTLAILSSRSEIKLFWLRDSIDRKIPSWQATPDQGVSDSWWIGLHQEVSPPEDNEGISIRTVPYWSIVLSVTLVSVLLLLSEPRPRPIGPVRHA